MGDAALPAVLYSMAVALTLAAAAMEWTRLIFQSYVAATAFTLVAAYPLAYYAGLPGIVVTWIVVECVRIAVLFVGLQSGTSAAVTRTSPLA
jgi:hypothetical protein